MHEEKGREEKGREEKGREEKHKRACGGNAGRERVATTTTASLKPPAMFK